jgi:hypothetical protein
MAIQPDSELFLGRTATNVPDKLKTEFVPEKEELRPESRPKESLIGPLTTTITVSNSVNKKPHLLGRSLYILNIIHHVYLFNLDTNGNFLSPVIQI